MSPYTPHHKYGTYKVCALGQESLGIFRVYFQLRVPFYSQSTLYTISRR